MDKPEFIHKGQLITDNAYYQWIENVKSRFHSTQAKAAIRVNTEMLRFYWSLGRDLVQMKAESTWGAGVLKQASMDLRASFPDAKGFSVSNLQFAKRWYLFYYNDLGKYYQVGNILSPTQDNAICCQVGNQFERSKLQQLVGDSEKLIF